MKEGGCMETKKVVLADSSYTIRRITELSFSEEEGIELITLENGFNIKEKLIELKPAVVLVDIKLSGLNGYDTCKFINETESLKETKVFLMKGGFEPVNEGLLKDLKYIDIITKPFDSNELVSSIKEMLDKDSVKAHPIAPEDLPEIDSIEEVEDGISFSDIEEELKSNKIISEDLGEEKEELYDEEVLPSEEITQGPQIDKESSLDVNTFDTDEIENPFKEEAVNKKKEEEVKEEIKVEEKAEEIESSDELFKEEETEDKTEVEEKEDIDKQSVEEKVKDFFATSTKETEDEAEEEIKFEEKAEEIESSDELFKEEETEDKAEEEVKEEIKVEEKAEKLEVPEAKKEIENIEEISQKQKEDLVEKVEDKLAIAVKEILWEIVPSLADKIIKEEIEKIKADINIEVK